MTDLPFPLPEPLATRLAAAADAEGKLVRALETLGPLADRDVALLGNPGGPFGDRIGAVGVAAARVPMTAPLRLDLPDASIDVLVSLWSGFRGVEPDEMDEVDRVLRPAGRLLVVHDYGRDDVSALRDPGAPEYGEWSRRDGPFLRDGGFRIRVVHCFWTFESLEAASAFLVDAFGDRGADLAARLRRPRLSWNVAVYHRARGA